MGSSFRPRVGGDARVAGAHRRAGMMLRPQVACHRERRVHGGAAARRDGRRAPTQATTSGRCAKLACNRYTTTRRRTAGARVQALTTIPGQASSARLDDVDEPPRGDDAILVDTLAIGVCGTDVDIVGGVFGAPPPGQQRLVLGHESHVPLVDRAVGAGHRVRTAHDPDDEIDEWDMCRNGRYTERGIKERDGYCAERYRIEPEFAVKIDPALGVLGVLLEPTSVVAKAWEHVERIGARARWRPARVLVPGAGPIRLPAALLGRPRGLA